MGLYDESGIGQYEDQTTAPSAPKGLQQAAVAAQGVHQQSSLYSDSAIGQMVDKGAAAGGGYVAASQDWFTGANREGESNGWAAPFFNRMIEDSNRALEGGYLNTQFDEEYQTTGVVSWDHDSSDGQQHFTFGDVYDKGALVGNVFDQFDRATASQMMLPLLFDGTEQARIFAKGDSPEAVGEEMFRAVQQRRVENNENIPKALGAADFEQAVQEKQAEVSPEATVAAATLGGAVTGAGTGALLTAWTGPGAALGAVVGGGLGALVGGVGGWLNRDELTASAARADEITEMATEKEGTFAGAMQGLQQWGQFAMGLTTPLSNLEHGVVDTLGPNKAGDLEEGYYAVDKYGRTTRPRWAKPLSLGATVTDSLMQFLSPLNRAVYATQMGSVVAGESGYLATEGTTFDPRQGDFENIFKDDEGHFDPVAAGAGLMKVGIDAVQMTGMLALARNATAAGREAKAALEAGELGGVRHAAGWKFTLDDAGQVISRRPTLALLAPSEQVAAANAYRIARVNALKDSRMYKEPGKFFANGDDFYKAASQVAAGGNKMKWALVNGFGEGYEELAQGLLEPVSVGGRIIPSQLGDAFLQGAAAGAGMSLGATFQAPTGDTMLEIQAYGLEMLRRNGVPMADGEWAEIWGKASKSEKRRMGTRSKAELDLSRQVMTRDAEDQGASLITSGADAAYALDSQRKMIAKNLKGGTVNTDKFTVIGGLLDVKATGRPEAIEASALGVAQMIGNRLKGLAIQRKTLKARIKRLEARDQTIQANVAKLERSAALLRDMELMEAVGKHVFAGVRRGVEKIYEQGVSPARQVVLIDRLNAMLESYFDGSAQVDPVDGYEDRTTDELNAAATQFVSMLYAREPKLDAGSYWLFLPQINHELTRDNSDDLLLVNTDILQAIGGDFDGDKMRAENQLIMSPERFIAGRAGQNLGGAGDTIDIAVRVFDKKLTEAIGYSLNQPTGSALESGAQGVLSSIITEITDRYGHLMSPADLTSVIDAFKKRVNAGSEDARVGLINDLARTAGGPITQMGRGLLTNEWLHISRIVRWHFQEFQPGYKALLQATPGATVPSPTGQVKDIDTKKGTNQVKKEASTDAQTLALYAVGNSLFRKFQKVHYSSYNTRVIYDAGEEPSEMWERAELYAELSRFVTRPELALAQGPNSTAAAVFAMLQRLVDSAMAEPDIAAKVDPSTALAVFANVKVQDVWKEGDVYKTDGRDISIAQLLLKRQLAHEREEHKATFDADESMKARHARLTPMTFPNKETGEVNAERAFIEIFGSVQFVDSIGDNVGPLAANSTPEQWLKNYQMMNETERTASERYHTQTDAYLARKKKANLPYSMNEMERKEITPYRSMMDAMIAVGRSELTFDADTAPANADQALRGRKANQSRRAMDDYQAAHKLVRGAWKSWRKLFTDSELTKLTSVEQVQKMFDQNRAQAAQILGAMPWAQANAIYQYDPDTDTLYIAPWIYKMFTIEDSKEALAYYWVNVTKARYRAMAPLIAKNDSYPGEGYDTLTSRIDQVMYELALEPGQLGLEMLLRQMDETKNLDELFLWINKTPGIRGRRAPLVPFVDDVAEFEIDFGSAWGSATASGDMRQAIAAMRRGAKDLRDALKLRAVRAETDVILADNIRKARDGDAQATPQDHAEHEKLKDAVKLINDLPRGFAPSSMLALVLGSIRGFDPSSTDKGITADSYQPLGQIQQLIDAFGYVPGLERALEILTSHPTGSLSNNISDMARTSGRGMDATGRQFTWEPLTVDKVLELLEDPETAPFAYQLLVPKALDVVNGVMTERMLMDASLKEVLDRTHYEKLWDLEGKDVLDRSATFLSVIGARIRALGGHFDETRYVESLALVRTSGLKSKSDERDRARLRDQAVIDTAKAMQLVAQILATPEMGSATLTELREKALEILVGRHEASQLPGFTDEQSGLLVSEWIDSMVRNLDAEFVEQSRVLKARTTDRAEFIRQEKILAAQYEVSKDKITKVLSTDHLRETTERFRLVGDPMDPINDHARLQITEYAMGLNSGTGMKDAGDAWAKMADQRFNGKEPDLSAAEWDVLSRSVMGHSLGHKLTRMGSHVSVPPFEKAGVDANGQPSLTDARFYKFFDPAYAWLARDILSDTGPMAEALTWFHTMSGQPRGELNIDDMAATLKSTVLNPTLLGPITSGLKDQLIETQTRMDSAGAGPATAAAGNGPVRQAWSLAVPRNGDVVPTRDLLTTAAFSADMLNEDRDLFRLLPVSPKTGVNSVDVPVALLDNRYYGGLRVNGVEVSLIADGLGFAWHEEDPAAPTGYQYIALPRLRRILTKIAADQGVPLSALDVEVDFFHPDSRPGGTEWMHNVYFDGMSHHLLPDDAESLVSTLWSDNGSMIGIATQKVLDATKNGKYAVEQFFAPDAVQVAEAEQMWSRDNNLAAMLRAKTKIAMEFDKMVPMTAYNAVFKHLAAHHIVVGYREDGTAWYMTAEEVIAFQNENGFTTPLPLADAELRVLSPDVLRSMIDPSNEQGVHRYLDDEYLLNKDEAHQYNGATDIIMSRFAPLLDDGTYGGFMLPPGSPADTDLTNVGLQKTMKVKSILTNKELNARQERRKFLHRKQSQVGTERAKQLKGQNIHNEFLAVLQLAGGAVGTEMSTFDFAEYGLPIGPRRIIEAMHSQKLLEKMQGISDPNSQQRGFIITDEGHKTNVPGGRLTVEQMYAKQKLEHQIVLDDLALLMLDTFETMGKDPVLVKKRVEKALQFLVEHGATIALGSNNGGGDLREHAAFWLEKNGYASIEGSKHLFGPVEFVVQTQNERAYESTYTETRRLQPYDQTVTFLADEPIGTDENDGVPNPDSGKLRARKLISNILPSRAFNGYNIVRDDSHEFGLSARALAHVKTAVAKTNTESRAILMSQSGKDVEQYMTFKEALDRLADKLEGRTSLMPEIGDDIQIGDIIPFLHPNGTVIFYRHGFKLPKKRELQPKFDMGGLNIAVAKADTEPMGTANSGRIIAVEPRPGYGHELAIDAPLQVYGNKVQLEWNGMKYILVPGNARLKKFMKIPLFGNGMLVDLWADKKNADKKEAFLGRIDNHRNAMAFFQTDLSENLVEFFFPDAANRPPQAALLVYSMLDKLSKQQGYKIPLSDAAVLSKARFAISDMLATFAEHGETKGSVPRDWQTRMISEEGVNADIARGTIIYMLTKGADIDNIWKTSGFSHPNAGKKKVWTREVPGIWVDLVTQGGIDSEVHRYLIKKYDDQLKEQSGAGWTLQNNWVAKVVASDDDFLEGHLQYGLARSSGDNPRFDGEAFDPNAKGNVSDFNAMASAQSIGAITAHKPLKKAQAFIASFRAGEGVSKPGTEGEDSWSTYASMPNTQDRSKAGWRRENPAETVRREVGLEEIIGFYQPLNMADWDKAILREYQTIANSIINTLNLSESQAVMLDTWVRMQAGRPHGLDPETGEEQGIIPDTDALGFLKDIRDNLRDGLLPVAGAHVPLWDLTHLTVVFDAQQNRTDGKAWAPRMTMGKNPTYATSFNDWVDVAFGTAWIMRDDGKGAKPVAEPEFDEMFRLAVDAIMHGYQNATNSTRNLPVASDEIRQRRLMDAESNRMLVSTSEDINLLARDPILFHTQRATLDELIGGQRIYANGREGPEASGHRGRQKQRIERWRKESQVPTQAKKRNMRGTGQTFLGHTTTTNMFWRSAINLRAGNALFNFPLVVSAPIEAFYRRTINTTAQVMSGNSTGIVGKAQARFSDALDGTKAGDFFRQAGMLPSRTRAEIDKLDNLIAALSTRPEFKAMVYKAIMYQYPTLPGIGTLEKWLERYAKFGARIQDPAWGMLPKDLARIYVETATDNIAFNLLGDNIYSVETFIAAMSQNPEWLMDEDAEAHDFAIARIANIRSVKPNVLALGFRGVLEPLSQHPNFAINSSANMLKMLTLFQGFWSNSVMNMLGLQGPFDFAAFWLDGRKKSKLNRRMSAALAGKPFIDEGDERYDMTEAIEGMDLADSFIRGGVTHTGLFMLGMLAGELGLSGEDDEEKWRRRAAELQGAGFIHDARKLEADFRNKDSIFLNWLPWGMDSWFLPDPDHPGKAPALAGMSWTMRYFMSPIIGMERFFESGDFTEVIHGFKDALGAHPVVNAQLWGEVTDTVAELQAAANDANEEGDYQHGGHLLLTAVGIMERMLLENAMVNAIYTGVDRYDRDPYTLPALDSDGNPQIDVRGNPYQTNEALHDFVDDKGTKTTADDEIRTGYVSRDAAGATLRTLTENRFSLAFLSSIATGVTGGGFFSSDVYRQNMPVKVRKVEMTPTDPKELAADFLAAYQGAQVTGAAGTQVGLTESEAAQRIKTWYQNHDIWWDADEVEKMAKTMSAQSGMAAMSVVEDGVERITDDGARAIIDGLRKGSVDLGSASLDGVYMTLEQRNLVRDQLVEDITKEGIGYGLTQDQALWRMRRIMFGTGTVEGTAKLIDYIYTDQIPWTDTLEYNQLNTTYVMGPDGLPWATNFTRGGFLGAIGLNPLRKVWTPEDTGLGMDSRMNTVDNVVGINTGLRALEARPESWEIPSIEDVTRQAAKDIIKAIEGLDLTPPAPYQNKSGTGYGYGGYRHYKRSGSGYRHYPDFGGRGSFFFNRMYSLPEGQVPYGRDIPFINTSNPLLRRADIRRERVWSERGRLKQWQ